MRSKRIRHARSRLFRSEHVSQRNTKGVAPGNEADRRRTKIAYTAEDEKVSIIGVFHGGRDYEAELQLEE
jgi:hypothetical protein